MNYPTLLAGRAVGAAPPSSLYWGWPLINPPELKPELKPDLKADLKPVVIDFKAFRALANKALAVDSEQLSEDDLATFRDRG